MERYCRGANATKAFALVVGERTQGSHSTRRYMGDVAVVWFGEFRRVGRAPAAGSGTKICSAGEQPPRPTPGTPGPLLDLPVGRIPQSPLQYFGDSWGERAEGALLGTDWVPRVGEP